MILRDVSSSPDDALLSFSEAFRRFHRGIHTYCEIECSTDDEVTQINVGERMEMMVDERRWSQRSEKG